MTDSLLTSSNYEDVNVPRGTIYYYVVTTVDQNANESTYSNEVHASLFGNSTGNGAVGVDDRRSFLNRWLVHDCDDASGVDRNRAPTVETVGYFPSSLRDYQERRIEQRDARARCHAHDCA